MINPKNKNLKLIYRATVDGQMGKDFHSKCDNVYPTITFFKTKSNKKFGGYTESNWKINSYAVVNAYIFSINKKNIIKLIIIINIQYIVMVQGDLILMDCGLESLFLIMIIFGKLLVIINVFQKFQHMKCQKKVLMLIFWK